MTKPTPSACPECGARRAPGAEQCDLCGAAAELPTDPVLADPDVQPVAGGPSPNEAKGVFCNQCGWHNPPSARFCSQCGTRLQTLRGSADEGGEEPSVAAPVLPPAADEPPVAAGREAVPEGMGRQLGVLIGAAVLLVVGLYVVTLVSKQGVASEPAAPTASAGSAQSAQSAQSVVEDHELDAQPLPEQIAAQAGALEQEIAGLDGEAKLAKQRELIGLYVGAGRSDRAAVIQQDVAEAVDTPDAWTRTGNLFYEWMESVEEGHKAEVAPLAIAAYQKVLETEPDDVDVRAKMAWAYQYDRQSPMEAITQTNLVLEQDPDHLQANFNRGLFLMRISRFDQAIEQLERVKEIAGEGTPISAQAQAVIEAVRELQQEEESS